MVWTTPMTAVDGNVFTAAEFNLYVRDNLNDLDARVEDAIDAATNRLNGSLVAHLQRSGAQSIPNTTDTLVSFTTANFDPYSGWDPITPSVWEVPIDGWYMINAWLAWSASTTGFRAIVPLHNGTPIPGASPRVSVGAASGLYSIPSPTVPVQCTAGDLLSMYAWQNSGDSLDLSGATVANASLVITYVQAP